MGVSGAVERAKGGGGKMRGTGKPAVDSGAGGKQAGSRGRPRLSSPSCWCPGPGATLSGASLLPTPKVSLHQSQRAPAHHPPSPGLGQACLKAHSISRTMPLSFLGAATPSSPALGPSPLSAPDQISFSRKDLQTLEHGAVRDKGSLHQWALNSKE